MDDMLLLVDGNFYPRPPRGGRLAFMVFSNGLKLFLSTPSARRATEEFFEAWTEWKISIHALREEGDRRVNGIRDYFNTFLSTPSARRATFDAEEAGTMKMNFYPRPPRGGRRDHRRRPCPAKHISIHALREEGDPQGIRIHRGPRISIHALREEGDDFPGRALRRLDISIHALREEGDPSSRTPSSRSSRFLSTPSARRATGAARRPLKGEGISIHALREEGDLCRSVVSRRKVRFLSTPSARRATEISYDDEQEMEISIHALREEGDSYFLAQAGLSKIFLSTPSARRATTRGGDAQHRQGQFLSTPSARRATSTSVSLPRAKEFLSTPSARRATRSPPSPVSCKTYFYPRPPRGGRRRALILPELPGVISIHALREEGDLLPGLDLFQLRISIHALREEGDQGSGEVEFPKVDFYPRPPRGGRLETLKEQTIGELFLSTPSARRATQQSHRHRRGGSISIHALREEGDRDARPPPRA